MLKWILWVSNKMMQSIHIMQRVRVLLNKCYDSTCLVRDSSVIILMLSFVMYHWLYSKFKIEVYKLIFKTEYLEIIIIFNIKINVLSFNNIKNLFLVVQSNQNSWYWKNFVFILNWRLQSNLNYLKFYNAWEKLSTLIWIYLNASFNKYFPYRNNIYFIIEWKSKKIYKHEVKVRSMKSLL